MFRKLLVLALLLSPLPVHAIGDLTDEEILAIAGPKTCEFGGFTDINSRQVSIPVITLDPNITQEYCFRLPRLRKRDIGINTNGFVLLQTANLSNTTCGTATVFLIRPDRKPLIAPKAGAPRAYANVDASQPAAVLYYTPGMWRVLIRGESGFDSGCNKYSLSVSW